MCLKEGTNNRFSGRDMTYCFIYDKDIEIIDCEQSPGKYVAYSGYFGSYVVRVYTNGTMRGGYLLETLGEHEWNMVLEQDAITSLEFHRRNKQLTRETLGNTANVNVRTIEQYEQKRRNINNAPVSLIFKLARALDIKIDDLIDSKHSDEGFNEDDE